MPARLQVGRTETPDTDMSMTKQRWVVPSAKVKAACGLAGMKRASALASDAGILLPGLEPGELLANFSRLAAVISSSHRKPPAVVSLMTPSKLPKSRK